MAALKGRPAPAQDSLQRNDPLFPIGGVDKSALLVAPMAAIPAVDRLFSCRTLILRNAFGALDGSPLTAFVFFFFGLSRHANGLYRCGEVQKPLSGNAKNARQQGRSLTFERFKTGSKRLTRHLSNCHRLLQRRSAGNWHPGNTRASRAVRPLNP